MKTLPTDLTILETDDGSPTLAFQRPDGFSERMHSGGGALTESLYIYGEALERLLAQSVPLRPVRVLSFGLGLGYNELITIARLANVSDNLDWRIFSFEALASLRQEFHAWANREMSSELNFVTEDLAQRIAAHFSIEPLRLKSLTQQALDNKQLELHSSFPEAQPAESCNLVYYDAFSNRMNQAPWDEQHLINTLKPVLKPDCIFTSYAATGTLKRALKHLGFRLIDRQGFHGKRESTLAIRGAFL